MIRRCLLASFLLGGALYAQTSVPPAADTPASQPIDARRDDPSCLTRTDDRCSAATPTQSGPIAITPNDATASPLHPDRLLPAIDGSGLIRVGTNQPMRLGLSVGSLAGYDSALLAQPGLSTAFFGAQTAAAFALDGARSHLLLQDGFTMTDYRKNGDTLTGLNRVSLDSVLSLSQRWTLHAGALNTYGNDSIRAIAPIQENPIANTSAPNSDTTSFGLRGGTVQQTSGEGEVIRQQSARSGWVGSASVSHLQWEGSVSQNLSVAKLEYLHLLTRDLTVGAYALGSRQTGDFRCDMGGPGARMYWSPMPRFSLTGNAAPLIATSSCGRRFNMVGDATAAYRFGDVTALYVSFSREPNPGYIGQNAVVMAAGGGIKQLVGKRAELLLDYTSSFASSPNRLAAYQQTYAGASARLFFTSHLTQEISVRRFSSNEIGTVGNRVIAQTTLWWTSQPNDLQRKLRHHR